MKKMKLNLLTLAIIAMTATFTLAQPPGGRGGQGGPGGPGGGGPGSGPPPTHPIVAALDIDGDHELSASEIENAIIALKSLDKNGDGKLTDADAPQGFVQQHGGGRGGFGGGPGGRGGDGGGPGGGRGGAGGGPGGGRGGDGGGPGGGRGGAGGGPGGGRGGDGGGPGGGRGGLGGEGGGGAGAYDFVSRIMAFDTNEDGVITNDELPDRMKSIMERHDKNKDGSLDKAELDQIAAATGTSGPGQRGGMGGPGGPGGGRGPGGPGGEHGPGGPGGPPSPEQFIEHAMQFDVDGDKKLSETELKKFAEQMPPPPGGGPPHDQ